MGKTILLQYIDVKSEIADLEDRINKINDKGYIISDSVKGSSKEFPYTTRNYTVTGLDNVSINKVKKLKNILEEKRNSLIDLNIQAEEFLETIEDSEMRIILRNKYIDNKNYIQIAHDMNNLYKRKKYTADGIRMKHDRFIKKL